MLMRAATASRRRGLGWIVGVGALVVVAGVAWRVGASAQSPSQAAARAQEPVASWVTAPVERRTLTATVIQRGDIRAEVTAQVAVPASVEGAPVVTQIIVAAGDQVVEGDRVVEVSGRPVFVLAGDVPVYRSLRPGMSGVDVAQLQAALARLGYRPDADGVYGPATKTAVAAFYQDAGYTPTPASPTATVDIAVAQQAVTDANAAVAAAQAVIDAAGQPESVVAQALASMQQAQRALNEARAQRSSFVTVGEDEYNVTVRARDRLAADPTSTPGDLDAANLAVAQAGARLDDIRRTTADAVTTAEETLYVATIAYNETVVADTAGQAQADLDAATTQRDQANANLAAVQAANGPTVAQGEIVFMPSMPARVIAATSALGPLSADPTTTTAGGGLVALAGGGLIVTTSIRPGDIGLVRAGMDAEILDETTATTYPATITSIAPDAASGADGRLGYPTVITPLDPLPDALTGANVRVTITTAATESPELVVPLAAVSSAADGTTRVSVVSDPNGVPDDVEVDPGLSADGFVTITPTNPDALHEGDLVVVGT